MAVRFKDGVVLNKKGEPDDLLVFGYSCKLFRDDEKALFIDQGKHLIPWMGDDTLKIDRYDARGTLYDLKHAEPPVGGYDRLFGLTETERHVEMLCEQERYRALITNEEEESMYKEEEMKRLQSALNDKGNSYGQVAYKYDGNTTGDAESVEKSETIKTEEAEAEEIEDDEPFVPSPQLDIPINMVLPETMKHNAIIEKTALFITSQGPQMEILLKMKQAGNPHFNFLSFDNSLHAYYRLLLMAMKAGRYHPVVNDNNQDSLDAEADKEDADDHYLHPSLASSISRVELAPSIPSINYKPSADCAYSMLVSRIKDKKDTVHVARVTTHNVMARLKESLTQVKEEEADVTADGDSNSSAGSNHACQQVKTEEEMPTTETQVIIDKMASYVAKNGRDFENIVKSKKDSRFDFLDAGHCYHAYYESKVRLYEALEGKVPKGQPDDPKKALAPVSFSIKKPRDAESVIDKSALPVEESSEDEGAEKKKEGEEGEAEGDKVEIEVAAVIEEVEITEVLKEEPTEEVKEVEMVDLAAIEDKEEKTKKILATERLKDKLTAAVRGKVAIATKEKQLQLERKRRAAAFLKALKSQAGDTGLPVYGPSFPGSGTVERTDNGDSDVASLPDGDEVAEEPTTGTRDRHRDRHKRERHAHKTWKCDRSRKRTYHLEEEDNKTEGNERLYEEGSGSEDISESSSGHSSESPKKKARGETHSRRREEKKQHKKKKRKKDESPRRRSKSRKHRRGRSEEDGKSKREKKRSRPRSADHES